MLIELPAQQLLKQGFEKRRPSLFAGIEDVGTAFREVGELFQTAVSQGLTTLNDAALGIALSYFLEDTLLSVVWEWHGRPVRLASALFLNEWHSETPDIITDGPKFSDPMFYRQAVKLFADGSNQGVTGYQREPYTPWALERTQNDYLSTHVTGNEDLVPAVLAARIKQAAEYGWQVMIHANGDAAIDDAIKAHQLADSAKKRELRHRIEHCSILHDEQIASMVELGLSPSFLIEHVGNWGAVLGKLLGEERVQRLIRCGSVRDAGLKFSFHSDYPVSNLAPLLEMQDAVTRVVRSTGEVLNPQERISVTEALKAKTINAAWHCHLDAVVGSLDVGKRADLVVLQQDPHQVAPEQISKIPVLQTWVDGRQVYAAGMPAT